MFIGIAQIMWCYHVMLLHTVPQNQNQLYRSSMQTLVFPLVSVYLIEFNLLENNNINNNKLHRESQCKKKKKKKHLVVPSAKPKSSVSLLSHTTWLWLYKRAWMNHMSNCWCSEVFWRDGCLLQVSALCISQSWSFSAPRKCSGLRTLWSAGSLQFAKKKKRKEKTSNKDGTLRRAYS